jgi:hypothetical protein
MLLVIVGPVKFLYSREEERAWESGLSEILRALEVVGDGTCLSRALSIDRFHNEWMVSNFCQAK